MGASLNQRKILTWVLLAVLLVPSFSQIPDANAAIVATGGTITTSGIYKIHTFTSSGTFTITAGSGNVDYLVIAGGGGGGFGGGGGGAGGYRTGTFTSLGTGSYPVVVGAGGAGALTPGASDGGNGTDSSVNGITSVGGSGGSSVSSGNAGTGGSGGGGGNLGTGLGGAGTAGQGKKGGNASGSVVVGERESGGGGGASGAGANATTSAGGNGGAGLSSSITGSAVTRAGGGGGGAETGDTAGTGGTGGGGNGGAGPLNGVNATASTGSGGGGGGIQTGVASFKGGFGANGIVILRYSIEPDPPTNPSCTSVATQANCSWSAPSIATGITGYYIGKSLDNITFTNKTLVGNVTSTTLSSYFRPNTLYYINVTSTIGGVNSTTSPSTSFTTDNIPSAPLNPITTPTSDTVIKLNWNTPASNGNDPITQYRIEACLTCTSWTLLSNNTVTLNYNHTGLASGQIWKYRVAAWNGVGLGTYTANFTGSTFIPTTGSISLDSGVIGDVIQLNGTISIATANPTPVSITQSKFYVDGSVDQTRSESLSIPVSSSADLDPFWYRITDGNSHIFSIKVTASNSTGTVTLSSTSNVTTSREYNPNYADSMTTPETLGQVNYTTSRFNTEDGVGLKVNRVNVAVGQTWPIDCILQTNSEAAQTKNQSLTWQGTWINYSDTGYFNGTWTGLRNTHGYITCVNPPNVLFTTTSFTNSSLSLFGIQIFDESYGSMLGVPVGIFFLAMAGAMANKRTAPTWIIVVLGMAGTMAAIGFFTLNPLVWGLALVAALCGVFVNQKIF